MAEIIPAILAKNYEELEQAVRKVEPYVQRVHLDIMDGVFVNNKTIKGFEELMRLKTNVRFDVHLMVSNPESEMFNWYETPADRYIFHAEQETRLRDVINQVKLNGKRAGLTLNPETPVEKLDEYMEDIDHVQFMCVPPGLQGQEFIPSMAFKIQSFRQSHDIDIAVDGGMNKETAPLAIQSGATILVVGSYILNSPDIAKTIQELKQL